MNVETEYIYNACFNHFPYEFIETEFGLTEILHFTRLGISTNDHDHMCLGLSPTFLLGLLHSKVIKSTHVHTERYISFSEKHLALSTGTTRIFAPFKYNVQTEKSHLTRS